MNSIPTYEDSPFEGFPLRKIPLPHFKGSQPLLMTLTENLITPGYHKEGV